MRTKLLTSIFAALWSFVTAQDCNSDSQSITLRNDSVHITFLDTGAISDFRLHNSDINPFDWCLANEKLPEINQPGHDFQGHFVSLGTWGMPTKGEQEAGLRLYGEANSEVWEFKPAHELENQHKLSMGFKGTIEGLDFSRDVLLAKQSAAVLVKERITNRLPIGRPYNCLQHGTFGGMFVDEQLRLATNASKGFLQKGAFPRKDYETVEDLAFTWPNGIIEKNSVDLRHTGTIKKTFLTSHLIDEKSSFGWAVAYNPTKETLVGYIWKKEEYPWLNIWQQANENGQIVGRALEFATCGMGISFEEMMTEDRLFFGTPSLEFIDAGETIHKSYVLISANIPNELKEVTNISVNHNANTIQIDGIVSSGERWKTELLIDEEFLD